MSSSPGLPRSDVPARFMNNMQGHLGLTMRRKPRAVLGRTNRREFFEEEAMSFNGTLSATAAKEIMNVTMSSANHSFFTSTLSRTTTTAPPVETNKVAPLHVRALKALSHTPPPLPNPREILAQMQRESDGGIAGLMAPPQAAKRSASVPLEVETSERVAQHTHMTALPPTVHESVHTHGVNLTASPSRFRSTPDPGAMPRGGRVTPLATASVSDHKAIEARGVPEFVTSVPKPKLRQELTDYHSTMYVAQPPVGAGQYASPQMQFSSADRGVNHGRWLQQEKLHKMVLRDMKREQRAEHEASVREKAVVLNRKAEQLEANRQHKKQTIRADYLERIAAHERLRTMQNS